MVGQGDDLMDPGAEGADEGAEHAGDEHAEGTEGAEVADGADKDEGKGKTPEELKILNEKQQAAFNKFRDKEVAKRKSAEDRATAAEDEAKSLRERVNSEDGECVLAAAQACGVMPEMLGAADAKGLTDLARVKGNVRALENALEDADGDEVIIDGATYTKAQVKASLRGWRDKSDALEKRFGGVEAKARERALEVWKLGVAAKKAGWKPGQKAEKAEDNPDDDDPDEPDKKPPKPAAKKDIPRGSAEPQDKGGKLIEVKNVNDLADFIQEGRKSKK